jgi:hypothetical protein
VYITTRVPGFQFSVPSWLNENSFPAGHLHVAQSSQERENAADFKLRVLNSYIASGWRLSYAFGDSPTDFIAYERAGLPKERVFALKRKGRDTCEEGVYSACLDGWTEYLQTSISRRRSSTTALGVCAEEGWWAIPRRPRRESRWQFQCIAPQREDGGRT